LITGISSYYTTVTQRFIQFESSTRLTEVLYPYRKSHHIMCCTHASMKQSESSTLPYLKSYLNPISALKYYLIVISIKSNTRITIKLIMKLFQRLVLPDTINHIRSGSREL